MNQASQTPPTQELAGWIDEVTRSVESLRYGSVEITVHDGKVTQIERREKFRFKANVTNSPSE